MAQVKFDLHTKHLNEVMETMCFVQRHSDRLCNAIVDKGLKGDKVKVIENLIEFGVNVDFPPKAWAPLHFAASELDLEDGVMELLLDKVRG